MNRGLGLAAFAGLLLTASAAEAVSADRPRAALSVTPARLALAAPGSRRINARNDGAEQVVVDVLRRTTATRWLQISPEHLVLGPGRSAVLTVRAKAGPDAEPGDHQVLVLLTTRPQHGSRVALRLRLGVRVNVRMPGRVIRRLALGGVRVHRRRGLRLIVVPVVNRGNVTVQLRGHVTASLFRSGDRVARLRLATRPGSLAPAARTLLALRYAGRVRGPVIAVVQIRMGRGVRLVARRYRLRL
ncbi:hypothetical protein AYO48_01700 [Gaiella sp. SCGC AG-212-M14]|nr:hypothetical protein AYO48_01700 [Gaiella sp. SCGC AG-212-M14]